MRISEPKETASDLRGFILACFIFTFINFNLAWSLGASDYLTCEGLRPAVALRANSETVMCMIEKRRLLGLWYEKIPNFLVKDVMISNEESRSCSEGICVDIVTYNLILFDEKNNKKLFHNYDEYDLSEFDLQRLEKLLKDPKPSKINIHRWGDTLWTNTIVFIVFILTLFAPLSLLLFFLGMLIDLFYFVKKNIYKLANIFNQ